MAERTLTENETAGRMPLPTPEILEEIRNWIDHPSWDAESADGVFQEDLQQCRLLLTSSALSKSDPAKPDSRLASGKSDRDSESPEPTAVEQIHGAEPAAKTGSGDVRFRLERYLGAGAFGIVFAVFDCSRGTSVAIKILRPSIASSRTLQLRFLREAEVASSLDHPGIVTVLETGRLGSIPFLIEDIVNGPSLSKCLATGGLRLPFTQAASLIADVAEALQYAHERGVLHRDLKPSNILLEPDSTTDSPTGTATHSGFRPKLTDFGLARRIGHSRDEKENLSTGVHMLGTLRYMSPEQAAGRLRDVGISSDIYALGTIFYQCLTGFVPHDGGNAAEVMTKIVQGSVPSPRRFVRDIPRDLEIVVLKCLAFKPDQRYRSAGELAADLRRWQSQEPILARPERFMETVRRWFRTNPAAVVLSSILLTVVPISLLVISVLLVRERAASAQSDVLLGLTLNSINEAYVTVAEDVLYDVPDSVERRHRLHQGALETLKKVAAEYPDNVGIQYRLSVQYSYAGTAAERGGHKQEAQQYREECIATLERLLKDDPNNLDYRYDIFFNRKAMADGNITNHWPDRIRLKEQVLNDIVTLSTLAPDRPEFADAVASCKKELARDYAVVQDPRAEALFRDSYEISDRLWRQCPDKVSFAKYSLMSRAFLADLLRDQGRVEESEVVNREAESVYRSIPASELEEVWFIESLREHKRSFAETCFVQKRWKEAESLYQDCVAIETRLHEHYPPFSHYSKGLCQFLTELLRVKRIPGISPDEEADLRERINTLIKLWRTHSEPDERLAELEQRLNDKSQVPLRAGR